MNATSYYQHMSELLNDIQSHIKDCSHAMILVNDYLILQNLFADHNVDVIKKVIEQKITTAEDWTLVKETFIPTLAPEQQELLKPLLEK